MESQDTSSPNEIAVTVESAPTPEVIETPVEPAVNTESATVEEPATQNIEEEGAKPSKAVQELIAQRKRRQVAEQDAAYWRGIAEGRGHKVEKAPEPKPQLNQSLQEPVAPVSDNFETWDDYEQAKDEYLVAKAEHRMATTFRNQQIQQQQAQKQLTFNQKMDEAAQKDPSIYSIMEDNTLPIHTQALPILFESDVAPELLKMLNSNRKEATRIYQLFNNNPLLAARELGKLEAKIINTPKPSPPKRVSQAPEPIPTVTPSGSNVIDEDSLPIDQWIARRNKTQYRK